MSVVHIEGNFKIFGVSFKTEQEMNALLEKMMEAMRKVHPNLRFNSDVELDMDDGWKAGKFDNEPVFEISKNCIVGGAFQTVIDALQNKTK